MFNRPITHGTITTITFSNLRASPSGDWSFILITFTKCSTMRSLTIVVFANNCSSCTLNSEGRLKLSSVSWSWPVILSVNKKSKLPHCKRWITLQNSGSYSCIHYQIGYKNLKKFQSSSEADHNVVEIFDNIVALGRSKCCWFCCIWNMRFLWIYRLLWMTMHLKKNYV